MEVTIQGGQERGKGSKNRKQRLFLVLSLNSKLQTVETVWLNSGCMSAVQWELSEYEIDLKQCNDVEKQKVIRRIISKVKVKLVWFHITKK